MTSKIVHDLAQVIRSLGERDGYTMVMEKGSILWGAPNIDITDQVIRSYNAMHVAIGSVGESGGGGVARTSTTSAERAGAPEPSEFGSTAAKRSSFSSAATATRRSVAPWARSRSVMAWRRARAC